MSVDHNTERRRIQALMKTEDGRAWVWDHLSMCGVFQSSYAPEPTDTAFNEGRRSIGLRLIADLHEHAMASYQLMEREAIARAQDENDEVDNDVAENS